MFIKQHTNFWQGKLEIPINLIKFRINKHYQNTKGEFIKGNNKRVGIGKGRLHRILREAEKEAWEFVMWSAE